MNNFFLAIMLSVFMGVLVGVVATNIYFTYYSGYEDTDFFDDDDDVRK